jgi:protein-tyrosine phosphatase
MRNILCERHPSARHVSIHARLPAKQHSRPLPEQDSRPLSPAFAAADGQGSGHNSRMARRTPSPTPGFPAASDRALGSAAPHQAAPFRVMTVCTGNICRSPMAEIVLRDRLEAAGLGPRVVADSTGVSDEEHGNPIDRRARATLLDHGYDVGVGHRARRVTPSDLASRDLVLAMTSAHARALRRLAGGQRVEVIRMYRSFDPAAPRVAPGTPEHVLDVADPWYGTRADFDACLEEIEAAVDGIVAYVRDQLAEG